MRIRMGAKELVELGLTCGPGKIRREPYDRKDGVHVKAACVPDTGARGKTPPSKRWLPKLGPQPLGGWGKDRAASTRHWALLKKTRQKGCREVLRTVNAIANVTTDRPTERLLRSDYKWLRRQEACELKTKK